MSVAQDPEGRFRSTYDDTALLQVVRAVCHTARPDAPHQTTRAEFNAARPRSSYPDAPTAEQCSRRTGINWNLLRVKATQAPDLGAQMMAMRRRRGPDEITLEEAAEALRIVARRLGMSSLRPARYEAGAGEINQGHRKAWRHGGKEELLPPATRIENAVGWDAAVEAAGLDPRGTVHGAKGVSQIEGAERFLEENGYLPTRKGLEAWFRAGGISIAWNKDGYPSTLKELRARRTGQGRWTPHQLLPPEQRELLSEPEPPRARPEDPTVRRGRWTWEECVDALRRVRSELRAGQNVTQDRYQAISSGRPDLPSYSSLRLVAKAAGKTVRDMHEEALKPS